MYPLQRAKLTVPYIKDESTRCAVNQIQKSVVREICMLRSVEVRAPIWQPFYPALEQRVYS
jgi:hypothetical protein